MKNKVICVDFWNTIYDSSNGIERNKYRQRVLIDELDKSGIMIFPEEYEKAMKSTWDFFENSWKNNHRTPSAKECVEHLWKFTGVPFNENSIEIVSRAFEDSVLVHKPKLIPNAKEILLELSREYKLAIISDTGFSPGNILKELLEYDGILQYFADFSFSNETGYSKPNINAFNKVLNSLNSDLEKSFHIGDIEHTDIVGAKGAGLNAIRFSGSVTEYTNSRNSANTIADYVTDSWVDIYDFINNFNKN